jgi:hypothetical protein
MNDVSKIVTIYILILCIFHILQSNISRFFATFLLYIFSIYLFHINFKLACVYILLGIGASLTEHIFIKYINSSWKYQNPNLFTIPIWLILLWSLAILLITETIKLVK